MIHGPEHYSQIYATVYISNVVVTVVRGKIKVKCPLL